MTPPMLSIRIAYTIIKSNLTYLLASQDIIFLSHLIRFSLSMFKFYISFGGLIFSTGDLGSLKSDFSEAIWIDKKFRIILSQKFTINKRVKSSSPPNSSSWSPAHPSVVIHSINMRIHDWPGTLAIHVTRVWVLKRILWVAFWWKADVLIISISMRTRMVVVHLIILV
ncbi:hypothetical protein BpHYR1_006036 [Brachionus plicatilis]|uniref:Uncharacterized protein n=1 Tax=Brachionus plicatilis TaxID=10195 RepID=A0A3M7RBA4_BRAPC|nr:hypothetical protein BpHYR1_006036 [Brachionus plicatilis]